jgi:hypothetical protein
MTSASAGSGSSPSSSASSPTGLSAAQLEQQIAALQQQAKAAKSAQTKASADATLQQFVAQLAKVEETPAGSSGTPPPSSTGSIGQIIDTTA